MYLRRDSSIFALVALLIIAGIFLFIFRQSTLAYLSQKVFGSDNAFSAQMPNASKNANIDLGLLEKKEFKVLNNRVNFFDFNVVGKPVAQNSHNVNLPKWPSVYRGNFNPFLKPKPKVPIEIINTD